MVVAGPPPGQEPQAPAPEGTAAAPEGSGTAAGDGGASTKHAGNESEAAADQGGPMPRSSWLRSQLQTAEWSALVAVANHNAYDFDAGGDVAVRRRGKTLLEADRTCRQNLWQAF